MINPIVDILKSKKTGRFLLMHYAFSRKMGWNAGWGRPTEYSAAGFRRFGLRAVLKSLTDFPSRDGDDERKAFRISKEANQRRFVREHLSLGVRLQSASRLRLTPSQRSGGGYVGLACGTGVKLPTSAEKFLAAVDAALTKCS